MLSWRLWRSIADADINNPIFRRVSQIQTVGSRRPKPVGRVPRLLWLLMGLALIAGVILTPQFLIAIFVVPITMIMLFVAAPGYLPFVVLFAGITAANGVVSGIYREKNQRTYDLVCSSTQGALTASWSCAIGVLYRGGWFTWLRSGTLLSLRLGLACLGFLVVALLWTMLSNPHLIGFEQLRLLALIALFLILYLSNMTQTLVLSLIIGLWSSSFDWFRRDASFVSICLYIALVALPLVAGVVIMLAFDRWAVEPHPLLRLGVEAAAALVVISLRELIIALLWSGLKRRLNANRDGEQREVAARDAAWGVT